MKSEKRLFGDKGELLASDYLIDNNYLIIDKNWKTGHKEVDIIAEEGKFIVFIEVKTRKNIKGLSAEDVLSFKKREFLIEAAEKYIEEKKIKNEVRFDLVLISLQNEKQEIILIKDAFNSEL